MTLRSVLVALVALSIPVACVPKPEKAYSPSEVKGIDSLEELMRINASKADPLFGKRDQQSFSPSEYAAMADAGVLIEASALRTAEHHGGKGNYDEGFTKYAESLAKHAKALADAAGEKDASKAREAITGMRETCKACHGVYR